MMQAIVAVALWCLVAATLAGTKRRTDQSILYAAAMIAVSMSLNVGPLYLAVDGALGGRNYVDLAANLMLLFGVHFLSRAILRASSPSGARTLEKPFFYGAIGAAVIAVTSFLFISAPQPSDSFMRDFGAQPAAAVYSMIQFAYIGVIVTLTGTISLRFAGQMSTAGRRAGFRIIGAGCAVTVLSVLSVLGMDIAHVIGADSVLSSFSAAYNVLNPASIVLLCAGLSLPPVLGAMSRVIERRRLWKALPELNRIWGRVSAQHVDLDDSGQSLTSARNINQVAHRTMVEIRDALLLDASVQDLLTIDDLAFLAATEARISAQGIPA